MKAIPLILATVVAVNAIPPALFNIRPRIMTQTSFISKITNKVNAVDTCKICVDVSGQIINQVLNIILNVGVIGSCSKLCTMVEQKTGSQIIGVVCDIGCDFLGIDEFVKLIQKADLDPIYYCEIVKMCAVNDHGDAHITKFSITPVSGPQGPRTIDLTYVSKNGTGTGEMVLVIHTVDGIPVETGFLNEPAPAGTYPNVFNLKAQPDPDCDPTQQVCEQWLPGDYTMRIDLCNGECGSKHPHSKLYDTRNITFTITK
ncbi:countin-3-like [Gigantopelta aegis]|uniref:countin-3-like n=1 Tax=Gigantopelta aegis TaxID=1735272 RepID=UPI001B88B883|nr:countin-3-like [Gigantopelta aegis]